MNMKLENQQRVVVRELKEGKEYYYNALTSYRPFTRYGYGITADFVHGKIMNTLEAKGIIQKEKINVAMFKYSLTELGKTIEL